jgi:hypothetical protein
MPLTPFQQELLKLLAANRSPDSFVAGGTVLNAADDSLRFSKDLDIFHDAQESVRECAERDAQTLREQGYTVEWLRQFDTFQRGRVARKDQQVILEWSFDSAFRFFPIETDPACGYRLNFFDAATNKVLALMGRVEPRDYLDTLHLHKNHLSIGALAWAAAGKDPGVNPVFIVEQARRNAHYRAEDFAKIDLAVPLDLAGWSSQWRQATEEAIALAVALPAEEVGCLYLNEQGTPVTPDPASPDFPKLRRHFGSVRGAWPVIRE